MLAVAGWLLDVFFPQTCAGCDQRCDGAGLCAACLSAVRAVRSPLCPVCGIPHPGAGGDHICSVCLRKPRGFRRARACTVYRDAGKADGPLATILHRYKYGGDVTLAPVLGRFLEEQCPFTLDHDLLIPVPLHIHRLRRRGFNQALLLAQPLAKRYGIKLDPFVLRRTRATQPQVGLPEEERRRNIAGAFAVERPGAVKGRSVLLVDDVFTTGATVDECAHMLIQAGADRVDVLTLAHAVLR